MSGPAFLGLLRTALNESTRAAVIAEIAKDLVHQGTDAILAHLPQLSVAARPSAH